MALLEVGTPDPLAPLVTVVHGKHTQVSKATLASGPLATWEETVTAFGAMDTAPDTTKTHT